MPASDQKGRRIPVKDKEIKTNAMRALERAQVAYTPHEYDPEGGIDGVHVASVLGVDPARVFKTLVTQGKSRAYFVFVIPVAEELDLKKAARAAGEKAIEMLPVKDLLSVTGYIRGGCSPVGMKKVFPTFIHESALSQQRILVSAGKIGHQVEVEPRALAALVRARFEDLTSARG